MMPTARPFLDQFAAREVHAVAAFAQMPMGDSQVRGERTRIFSKPSSSSRWAVASVITSFSATMSWSSTRLTMLSRATRPRMPRLSGTSTASPLRTTPFVMPLSVPQSSMPTIDVLRHVGEFARQVAGVGGLERGIGEALSRAVGRAEVLEHAQAFAEVGLDRRLDDSPGRLGHQAAHAGELADLLEAAARAGLDHQPDRVEVRPALARVGCGGASSSPRPRIRSRGSRRQ